MIRLLVVPVVILCCITCGDEKSDELQCRSDMKYTCKEWVEDCDNSRCDEEDYQKNCRPRIVFICE